MKKFKFLTVLCEIALFSVACSDDDNDTDGGPTANFESQVYASNNSNGNIERYDRSESGEVTSATLVTLSLDAEGIYYDAATDQITQASRTLFQLNTYSDIALANDGANVELELSSSADLESPRDIAVSANGDLYVVSDNADVDGNTSTDDGRLYVYTRNGNSFALRNTITVDFAVWGIEFVGNDLFVVVDKTSDIAVFTNFEATYTADATETPNKRITIEGITRTHGIAFDGGTMILTDIGDASSDTDGGFHIITNFQSKFDAVNDGGTMAVQDNQVRVAGSATFLGNPVSADYDAEANEVFIAERANGGGRILSFTNVETGGNIGPNMNATLSGASSVYFYKQ